MNWITALPKLSLLGAALFLVAILQSAIAFGNQFQVTHSYRFTAKLAFDGNVAEINHLVLCEGFYPEVLGGGGRISVRPKRYQLVSKIPGTDGVFVFEPSRAWCNIDLDKLGGSKLPEVIRLPFRWTPSFEWYDHFDPKQATFGIHYLSETAIYLGGDKGRIKVLEPFRLELTEPTETEIESALNGLEWLNIADVNPDISKRVQGNVIPTFTVIPREIWRDPHRHFPYEKGGIFQRSMTDAEALNEFINGLGGAPGQIIDFTQEFKALSLKGQRALGHGRTGRGPDSRDIRSLGVPRSFGVNYAQIGSKRAIRRIQIKPHELRRYDTRMPMKCVDGWMEPDFEARGLIYWFRPDCRNSLQGMGLRFPNKELVGGDGSYRGYYYYDVDSSTIFTE